MLLRGTYMTAFICKHFGAGTNQAPFCSPDFQVHFPCWKWNVPVLIASSVKFVSFQWSFVWDVMPHPCHISNGSFVWDVMPHPCHISNGSFVWDVMPHPCHISNGSFVWDVMPHPCHISNGSFVWDVMPHPCHISNGSFVWDVMPHPCHISNGSFVWDVMPHPCHISNGSFVWDVMPHPCHISNGSLAPTPLKLGHGWLFPRLHVYVDVITYSCPNLSADLMHTQKWIRPQACCWCT